MNRAHELAEAAAGLGVPLDDERSNLLDRFLDLLDTWNARFRLTGDIDRPTLLEHHVLDCLHVPRHIPTGATVIDIGSGAGFPGIIVAIARPDLAVTLLEPRRRRASFLGEATRTVPIRNARAVAARAEHLRPQGPFDVAVARAIRLDEFARLAAPLVRPGGMAIAMQTPSTGDPEAAAPAGFAPDAVDDYVLPDGSRRRLLLLRRLC